MFSFKKQKQQQGCPLILRNGRVLEEECLQNVILLYAIEMHQLQNVQEKPVKHQYMFYPNLQEKKDHWVRLLFAVLQFVDSIFISSLLFMRYSILAFDIHILVILVTFSQFNTCSKKKLDKHKSIIQNFVVTF